MGQQLASYLVQQPAVRADMGRAARERCERLFSIDASVSSWTTLLEGVAEGASRRARD
mgnify:CR=1 FL=1